MSTFAFGVPALAASAAAQSSFVVRATAGTVDFIQVNSSANPGYVMLFDAATAPVDGAVTPRLVWRLAANSTLDRGFDPPLRVETGCVLVFSSTGPTTKTADATAFFGGRVI